jgi:hypothetical protein
VPTEQQTSTEPAGILTDGQEDWEDVAKFWAKKWMELDQTATSEHLAQQERLTASHGLIMSMHRRQENFLALIDELEAKGHENPFPALRQSLNEALKLAHTLG